MRVPYGRVVEGDEGGDGYKTRAISSHATNVFRKTERLLLREEQEEKNIKGNGF